MEKEKHRQALAQERKALIIACTECRQLGPLEEQAYRILTRCNCIQPGSPQVQRTIKNCIEQLGCSRIVVVGHYDCRLLFDALTRSEPKQMISAAQAKLVDLANDIKLQNIQPNLLFRIMVEMNITEQIRGIANMYFVRRMIDRQRLTLAGAVFDHESMELREINRNGFTYNSICALN